MRPGVYASVMRNRKTTTIRRAHSSRHQYSWRKFFLTLFIGAVLFVPGLIVTIIGLEAEDVESLPEDSVLYKVIGPAALALGIALICSSGIYYCCWGFQSPAPRRHVHKHKKSTEHKEQHDPLQPYIYKTCTCKKHQSAVPTISNQSHGTGHGHGRSSDSPSRARHRMDELDRINSTPTSPEFRSCRHGNHSHSSHSNHGHHHSNHGHHHHHGHHGHHVHPSSPHPPDGVSHRHRHHSSSPTHHSHTAHPHTSSCNHVTHTDNQVPFINTDAPLAEGESGSMDISIDLSTEVPAKGLKY